MSAAIPYPDAMPFIPDTFDPPRSYRSHRLALEVLSPRYAEQDYACVCASRPAMRAVFGHDQGWLSDDWTYAQNLADLERHEREFDTREAFAYAVFELVDEAVDYAGCLYIKPIRPRSENDKRMTRFDAEAFCWFSMATHDPQFGALAAEELMAWVRHGWPFEAVAFPGRTIAWPEWRALEGSAANG